VIPNLRQKATNLIDLNTLELSVVIFFGTPNRVRIISSRKRIIAAEDDVLSGMASTHLVK
jgi:hypothetical protein